MLDIPESKRSDLFQEDFNENREPESNNIYDEFVPQIPVYDEDIKYEKKFGYTKVKFNFFFKFNLILIFSFL